jgi:hypothetical protein
MSKLANLERKLTCIIGPAWSLTSIDIWCRALPGDRLALSLSKPPSQQLSHINRPISSAGIAGLRASA